MGKNIEIDSIFKKKFNIAISLKNSNKLVESLDLFLELKSEKPDYYLSYVFIGLINWDLKRLDDASNAFKNAIKLNPNSEKTSLSYFHVLWDQGKQDEALNEMKRFLEKNESDEYQEILNGITNSE